MRFCLGQGAANLSGDNNLTEPVGTRQPVTHGAQRPHGQVHCLVVDDEPSLRRALSRALERFGFWSIEASDGQEAVRILEQVPIDMIITDVQMPGMDGITLLRMVSDRWPDIAVVVVTGVTEVSIAVSCLRAGAHDFITKPFQLDDIQARVEQALEKRRLILDNKRYQKDLEGMVQDQAYRIEELFLEGVQSLASALDARDAYTRGHSARVALYSMRMARQLGLSDAEVQLTELGAGLHDIGKIGVTDEILLKPGKLTDEEYKSLMEHPVIGARILDNLLKNAPEALSIVRSHHERLDGRGTPDGLAGDEIPVQVRIVTVADSFDAMTTARPYRGARSAEAAFVELRRCAGTQFDPDVVEAMIAAFPPSTVFPIPTPDNVKPRIPHSVVGVGTDSRNGIKMYD